MRLVLGRLLLILVLLAGWQAALVHPLEHTDDAGRLVHAGDGPGRGDSSPDPSAKLCDALSALTACAAQASLAPGVEPTGERFASYAAERLRRADPPPFLSQGPPALL